MTRQPMALLLAALAGASAWISLGTLAVLNERGSRLGILPPLWLLPTLVVSAVAVAHVFRLDAARSWPLVLTATFWLPWLPIRVPPAFLLWEGPLEPFVWGAAILGVVVSLAPAEWLRQRVLSLPPRIAASTIAAIVLVCSLATAAILRDRIPGGDEPHYLIITQSLMSDGDLRIGNNHERGDYFTYVSTSIPPDFLRRGVDGEIYSIHAPGLPALLIPAFAVAGYPGAVLAVALISALGLAATWRGAWLLTRDAAAAWAASLAVGFSAPMFLHSFSIFPDAVGAAIVAAATAFIVRLHAPPVSPERASIVVVGALLAILPWLHTRFSVIAGAAGLVVALRLIRRPDGWRLLAAFGVVPVVSAVAWFLSFWVIYGEPNPAAPYGGSRQNAIAWIPRGAAGLAFDQQFGLLANAPVMALVPVGLIAMWRTSPRLLAELLAIAVPYSVVVASFGMWWGGWAAPARLLVPILPIAAPFLAMAWRADLVWRAVFAGLTLVGWAIVSARVVPGNGALLYNERDGYDLLLDWLSKAVNLPLAFPSAHRTDPAMTALAGSVWAVAAAAGVIALWWCLPRQGTPPASSLSRARVWTVTSALGMSIAMLAATAVWLTTGNPITPAASAADFLWRAARDGGAIGVELPAVRLVSTQTAIGEVALSGVERVRGLGSDRPLFAVQDVPAGNYRVSIQGAPRLAGALEVSVGPNAPAIDRIDLEGLTSGETTAVVQLPVGVSSLVIRGDAPALARISRLSLRPDAASGSVGASGRALRAARFGRARLYFLDDAAYVEPAGIWTAGHSETRLVAASDDGGPVLMDLQSGPVQAEVELSGGDWRVAVTLAAGERRRIEMPAGRVITVRTAGGFRPSDVERGNGDRRLLGARLEVAGG